MVLTGAAGVMAKHDLEWYLRVYSYKAGKILLKPFKGLSAKLRQNAGSSDYKNASEIMKQILVKTVNFDISPYLKDIKPETLLVLVRMMRLRRFGWARRWKRKCLTRLWLSLKVMIISLISTNQIVFVEY